MRRRPSKSTRLAALGLACAALSAFGCRDRESDPSTTAASATSAVSAQGALLRPGAAAPEVRFHTHTVEALALSALRGRPVVVYFYPK
ncbi:MAG TPA: hypothetical protein VKY73_16950, partial [Polyangiaceae bacterium]|nr:hypothetical protein [Polyangiaceae bacterium]